MISIFRLKNGEDIIGQHFDEHYDKEYNIKEPMSVDLDYHGNKANLVMHHWLPVQLVAQNEVKISTQDVLCVLSPSNDMEEYYTNTVKKLRDILEAKKLADEMTDEEIEEAMNSMEEMFNNTIH
jgi:hypothetical protein